MQNDIFTEIFDSGIENNFDPHEPTEEEQQAIDEEGFDPSVRNDMEALLTNGFISKEVELAGHTFVLRTLTIGEELAVAEVCKSYEGDYTQAKAIATATVAAALETIDGRPLMHHLGPEPTNNIRKKFQYIRNKWYWYIINELYEHYRELLEKQAIAFNELRGK